MPVLGWCVAAAAARPLLVRPRARAPPTTSCSLGARPLACISSALTRARAPPCAGAAATSRCAAPSPRTSASVSPRAGDAPARPHAAPSPCALRARALLIPCSLLVFSSCALLVCTVFLCYITFVPCSRLARAAASTRRRSRARARHAA